VVDVGDVVVVDVVLVVTWLVVVVACSVVLVVAHPPSKQASQQLGTTPTQALPPVGATQWAGLRFTLQTVSPVGLVRQHVTKPGLPHVDRAAQRMTEPLQPRGSCRA